MVNSLSIIGVNLGSKVWNFPLMEKQSIVNAEAISSIQNGGNVGKTGTMGK